MTKRFTKSFTLQEPIPDAGIQRAIKVMQSGRLHRYNTEDGELSETELLEKAYAKYQEAEFCLACASGGYALHIALKAAGLKTGDTVITNGFTLAPVPGAIHNAGGKVVLVEIDENYCVDLGHLEQLFKQTASRFFLISHMRGHIADMQAVTALCKEHNVMLIEDCAHTMGASWDGVKSGNFGKIACFSTQTYKHMNSGEGGLLTCNDPELMARAIMHSGSYMLYGRHGAAPGEDVFEQIRLDTPNYSGRMDNLRAATLNAQLPLLDENCRRWNDLYKTAEDGLKSIKGITLSQRPANEKYVGSSFQFRADLPSEDEISSFLQHCLERGVELKWFGSATPHGFTSRYDSWRYIEHAAKLPNTLETLANTFDLRLPLTFDSNDIKLIVEIISEELNA